MTRRRWCLVGAGGALSVTAGLAKELTKVGGAVAVTSGHSEHALAGDVVVAGGDSATATRLCTVANGLDANGDVIVVSV